MENGRFQYEAALPLFKEAERSYSLDLDKRRQFTLGIEVPLPEMPERGEGGPPGGGMGGGPPGGGGQGAARSQPLEYEHWFEIELRAE